MFLCTVYVSVSYYLTQQIQEWPRFAMFLAVNQFSVIISECIGLSLGTTINPVVSISINYIDKIHFGIIF